MRVCHVMFACMCDCQLGVWNLTSRAYGECVGHLLRLGIPTLLLGGGGYHAPRYGHVRCACAGCVCACVLCMCICYVPLCAVRHVPCAMCDALVLCVIRDASVPFISVSCHVHMHVAMCHASSVSHVSGRISQHWQHVRSCLVSYQRYV